MDVPCAHGRAKGSQRTVTPCLNDQGQQEAPDAPLCRSMSAFRYSGYSDTTLFSKCLSMRSTQASNSWKEGRGK